MNTDIRRAIENLQRDLDEQSHLPVVDATLCQAIRSLGARNIARS